MSVPEVFFRIRQWLQKKFEKAFLKGSFPKVIRVKIYSQQLNISIPVKGLRLYPDTINVFGRSFPYNNSEINWHLDFISGKEFPLIFSKSIKILNNQGLSAKNVWEINRLHFLPFIVMNYQISTDEQYLASFIRIIRSWVTNNPYLLGVNWYSNIEVNIRLIVWFYCWLILDADNLIRKDSDFKEFAEKEWLPVIYQHCRYSFNNPSRYSSANNHLIAEYAGLFIATSLWKFPESAKWNSYAKAGLEKEILRQHSENGINKEEASEYIQFITDFFLISYLVGERTENPFSEGYREMLKKIFYYIYEFLDIKGNFPKYGDEDDGKCIILDPDPRHNNFQSLLTSGAIIFNDPVLKSGSAGMDMKNRILFGEKGEEIYTRIKAAGYIKGSKFYPEEGHFILRKQEGIKEIFLHFDAAPLGYLSIAAHGHADALSFLLHVDGQPVLVDPGTFTYHDDPLWRSYFIGTLAHNTIRINKTDQAKNGGPTLWVRHYKTKVENWSTSEEYDYIKASHDGYRQLGIIHHREVKFDKKRGEIKLKDILSANKKRSFYLEVPFHVHPGIELAKNDAGEYNLRIPKGRTIVIRQEDGLESEVIHGRINPEITGWYSGTFLQKEPSNTIIYTLKITEKVRILNSTIKII